MNSVVIHSRSATSLVKPDPSLSLPTPASHTYVLRGITVQFPFSAYECQLVFMERVIEALQTGSNALLESPTGTGKTLCLLCATLAWQKHTLAQMKLEGGGNENDSGGSNDVNGDLDLIQRIAAKAGDKIGIMQNGFSSSQTDKVNTMKPRIVYASRTHSQLAQVVSEMKSTMYTDTKLAILGSRQQLCVNPEVNKYEGSVLNRACQSKVSAKTCKYKENMVNYGNNKQLISGDILDIEDLKQIGEEQHICPYYMQIDQRNDAELVLMPYNYLLDRSIRNRLNLQLGNAIVIFDEAHNIESVSAESASFDLTSTQIAGCMGECDKAISDACATQNVLNTGKGPLTTDEVARLKMILSTLERLIDATPMPYNHSEKGYTGYTQPGSYMFDLLKKCDVDFDNCPIVLEIMDKTVEYLMADKAGSAMNKKACELDNFASALRVVYRHSSEASMAASSYYRVHIHAEVQRQQQQSRGGGKQYFNAAPTPAPTANGQVPKTLSYWCFYAGLTMNDLAACGLRSIMLASGTLSPLDSFAHELNIDFKIRLENPHVIKPEQVHIGILERGPANQALNSSFQNRSNNSYLDDLGGMIVNVCRIVPDGVLVFFASYHAMTSTLEYWMTVPPASMASTSGVRQSIFDRIQKHKHIVTEPKHANQFGQCIEEYHSKLSDPSMNGCVMFAVCRGKVSEGLDFSDRQGRCVIVTGIPYPNYKDAKVQLKKSFLDSSKLSAPGVKPLTGNEWYNQQSARALNQAIGRVIRHRNDFGSIILADERFSDSRVRNTLSMWLRPRIQQYKQFGPLTARLTQFFKYCRENCYDPALPTQAELSQSKASKLEQRKQRMSKMMLLSNGDDVERTPQVEEIDKFGNRIVPHTQVSSSTVTTQTLTRPSLSSALQSKSSQSDGSLSQTTSVKRSFTSQIQQTVIVKTEPSTSSSSSAFTQQASGSNLHSVVRTLRQMLTLADYTAIKESITSLSSLRTTVNDRAEQAKRGEVLIAGVAHVFAGQTKLRELAVQLQQALPAVFNASVDKYWLALPAPVKFQPPSLNGVQVKSEPIDLSASSAADSKTPEPDLHAVKKKFISDCKSLLNVDEYNSLKQYLTMLTDISNDIKHTLACVYRLFASKSERWYLMDVYCRICESKHRQIWMDVMRENEKTKTTGTMSGMYKKARLL